MTHDQSADERFAARRRRANYTQWFNRSADGYRALTDYLSTAFGTPFELIHTGGGCLAIEACQFEGNIGLLITDAEDILATWDERVESDHPLGYAVGVYRVEDEYYQDMQGVWHTVRGCSTDTEGALLAFVIDHDADTPDEVSALVARALAEARNNI